MANRYKGEVALEINGATYLLVFSTNAMCEVEGILGQSTDEVLAQLAVKPSVSLVRALLWGALRERHPDVDLAKAGDLVDAIGGQGQALLKIGEALVAAFPEAAGESPGPRKGAAAGTGRRS
jgi:hypothetical protein